MGAHLKDGEFQSDKYPTTPAGKVPLSVKDPTAQDLLWEYAQRRRRVDAEFSADLETALLRAGFTPKLCGVVCADDPKHEYACVVPQRHRRSHMDSRGWVWGLSKDEIAELGDDDR
jgi:hypothetical protein